MLQHGGGKAAGRRFDGRAARGAKTTMAHVIGQFAITWVVSIRYRTSMPLSTPESARQPAHLRQITVEGYRREDGLLELDACLRDTKANDYVLASGVRRAGDPVHEMRVRVTFDAGFDIVAAEACSDGVPYAGGCDTIAPAYDRLVGLNLVRGFRRTVGEMFSDVRGCSHLTELLSSLPSAAIQTAATFVRDNADTVEKPFQIDRCHALESTSDTVRRYYPKWYRKPVRDA